MEEDDKITIFGDTEAMDLMNQVNAALLDHGLVFKDVSDEEGASDHVVFQLQSLEDDDDDEEEA